MANTRIDRHQLQAVLPRLRKRELQRLLSEALGMLPETQLRALVEGSDLYQALLHDEDRPELLAQVEAFCAKSRAGAYYERPPAGGETSPGTQRWLKDFQGHLDRCTQDASLQEPVRTRRSFELLFALLCHVHTSAEELVFFADPQKDPELSWEAVAPAYLDCVARTATRSEYLDAVTFLEETIDPGGTKSLKGTKVIWDRHQRAAERSTEAARRDATSKPESRSATEPGAPEPSRAEPQETKASPKSGETGAKASKPKPKPKASKPKPKPKASKPKPKASKPKTKASKPKASTPEPSKPEPSPTAQSEPEPRPLSDAERQLIKERLAGDEATLAVVSWLEAEGDWRTKREILKGLGVGEGIWRYAQRKMLEVGLVEREGKGRGVRYRLR